MKRIYQGDCLDVIKLLQEDDSVNQKVDLIYIDPPFGIKMDEKFEMVPWNKNHQDPNRVDEIFPFIVDLVGIAQTNYLRWMYPRLMLMRELLSERGSIYVHLDWHIGHYMKIILDDIFGKENFRNEVIWGYKTGGIPEGGSYAKKHDTLFLYSKTKTPIFTPHTQKSYTSTVPEPHTNSGQRLGVLRDAICDLCGNGPGQKYRRVIMRDVWDDIETVFRNDEQSIGYATQKPTKLIERIINVSSQNTSIVCDFFGGSGTTAAVAEKLGRRWITSDINSEAIEITKKRLENQGCTNFTQVIL